MKTLTKLLLINVLLCFTFTIYAQTTFGVRAGINLANMHKGNLDYDRKLGLTLAGLANISISDHFGIQPELSFIQKGYKVKFESFTFGTQKAKVKLKYLEIPIHARYQISIKNKDIFFLAGPSFGYALNSKTKECFGGSCQTRNNDFDEFVRLELGLSFGAGVYLNNALFLDVRCLLGISNLNEVDDPYKDDRKTNSGLQIGVGYVFGATGNSE